MLLKHYLERGVSKAELARHFGVSRRTIHEWVQTGQLDRDLSTGGSRYSPRPAAPHKLDPYKPIIDSRLKELPGLSAQHRRLELVFQVHTEAVQDEAVRRDHVGHRVAWALPIPAEGDYPLGLVAFCLGERITFREREAHGS